MSRSVAIIGTRGYPSYYGGFETAVRYLAPYLADKGWDVTVYGRPGAFEEDSADAHPKVRSISTRGFENKSLSTLSFGLTAVLDTSLKKPDVVLIMNVANGFWLPFLRMRSIPSLINVDGIEWERAKWGKFAKKIFRLGAKFTAVFGTSLVSDAVEIQRRWLKEFHRKSVFIPYGGEVSGNLEVESGLEEGSYVLMVARFVPENTVSEFFAAVEEIALSTPVLIVGSSGYGGPLDETARDLAKRLPNVQWLGHINDDARLHSLWQHAGVYFHGHSVGGTNPALVQAMANGAPVVARDTVYNREVLSDSAIFCRPEPKDIADSVLKLVNSPEEQALLRERARSRAAEFYTWGAVCQKYEDELAKLVRTSKSHRTEK